MLTIYIIGICIVIYILKLFFPQIFIYLAFWPQLFIKYPWQIITSIFVHSTITHLLFNMFVLFIFGLSLERLIGSKRFLFLFLASGIFGNIAYLFYSILTNSYFPVVGASGAIYGILGTLAILKPDMKVVIFPLPVPICIRWVILILTLIDIILLPYSEKDRIAHVSHLSGLLFGVAYGYYLKNKF
ncbi:rhomboid family intramembrane serine protease [Methanocaldococcus indicus]|uniref:rhomboid family intramembrane serine protease n=1 Tax=Methanocaldococcus indicus TaxID=213231 RepID=UPI003C6D19A8